MYQLSSKLDIAFELLKELNPIYKNNVIPSSEKKYELTLPLSKVELFNSLGREVYDYVETTTYTNTEVKIVEGVSSSDTMSADDQNSGGVSRITYAVRGGDMLVTIADLFDCEVVQIKRWNNLRSNALLIDQQLIIEVPSDKLSYYSEIDNMTAQQRKAILRRD